MKSAPRAIPLSWCRIPPGYSSALPTSSSRHFISLIHRQDQMRGRTSPIRSLKVPRSWTRRGSSKLVVSEAILRELIISEAGSWMKRAGDAAKQADSSRSRSHRSVALILRLERALLKSQLRGCLKFRWSLTLLERRLTRRRSWQSLVDFLSCWSVLPQRRSWRVDSCVAGVL
jgi:hypothetical protein